MSSTPQDRRGQRRRFVAIFVACFAPGAIEATHDLAMDGHVEPWCQIWSAVAVLIELLALTAAFDFGMKRRMKNAGCFALTTAVAVSVGILESFVGWSLEKAYDVPLIGRMHVRTPGITARIGTFDGLLGLGLWAIAVILPFAVGDANARALEAEQLRTAAELARLRAHLQPHFLLNTLNTVAGLVGEDPREARKLIGALGDLLADSVTETDEMQTIEDELKWLKRYAGILETRHRGSLTFHWDIADATRSVRIPRLLLQPLLENAVKHGALRRREGGKVAVRTTIDPGAEGKVTCIVEDNGPGPASGARRPGALGIDIVTRRLALKYAGAAAFRLESDGDRTRSIVEIPAEAAA